MDKNTGFSVTASLLLMVMPISPVQAGWVDGGTAICTAPGSQWYPRIVMDGTGGGIVVWQDGRSGNGDVYVQRIDANGSVLLTADGTAACSDVSDQSYFRQVVPDDAGGVIIAWVDHRNGGRDVYVQRVDPEGNNLWTENGAAVCISSDDEFYPAIIQDGAGGAIVAWQRDQGSDGKVYVQRIGAGGEVLWSAGGIGVGASDGQNFPRLVQDGAGGGVVVWNEGQIPEADIRAQRIDAGGDLLWGGDGITVCTGCDIRNFTQPSPDGEGGVIIAWHDLRGGDYDIYAQKIDASGNVLWDPEGVGICTAERDQWFPQIIPDGSGGGIITWVDLRNGVHDIYAQRVDDSGEIRWSMNGIAVCAAELHQINPRVVSDNSGGAIITWQDYRSGEYDIFSQRIDSSGSLQWDPDGIAISDSPGDQRLPEITTDGLGGAIITWEDLTGESDVRCQRITASGEFVSTMLASFSARYEDSAITLTWRLSQAAEEVDFIVLRSGSGQNEFVDITGGGIRFELSTYYFTDGGIEPGESYTYRVEVVEEDGRKLLFETDPIETPPISLVLHQNFPNPFNPFTTIRYCLPERMEVALDIYDACGHRITRLAEGSQGKGMHEYDWHGLDGRGEPAASGVYFYRLKAGREVISRKMLLLR